MGLGPIGRHPRVLRAVEQALSQRLRVPLTWLGPIAALITCSSMLALTQDLPGTLPVNWTVRAVIGMAAATSLTLSLQISRRLQNATAAVDQIAGGRLERRIAASPLRELDDLSQAINRLARGFGEHRRDLLHRAYYDPLTRLPNRALFMSSLERAIAEEQGIGAVAVLFIDLDRFKLINDTLGHDVGDSLLSVASRRLASTAGRDSMVARMGGDEFTVLVRGPDARTRAVAVAGEITKRMNAPIRVAGHELLTIASVGIAVSEDRAQSMGDLLRKADIALYRAKAEGRARSVMFRPEHEDLTVEDVDLNSALHRAVERGQLALRYQPEVDLSTGNIMGMEALLRWNHPSRGLLSPADFIEMAESTGDIVPIGGWVLERACREASAMSARSGASPVVGVNLSVTEFQQTDVVARTAAALDSSGLPPDQLKLELTESALMEDIPATVDTLIQLKKLGVALAIDDFGTGYSSLSYLQHLPVDTLKVDQLFVGAIGHDPRATAIVDAIVRIGTALDLQVTAEGVETLQQISYLRKVGCTRGQGYYFSEPIPPEAFAVLLDRSIASADRPCRVA